ncbi:excitatory amino acid transporter 1-like [Gigantopelta aegis]|uniref:excitatory amino acid transporter 1-like n=1 Tax=Gigantopelta aegis TaxID=1735272 RepID=UPI001B88C557|nr:excitatory amino acid transporter 1-like [Gigantopelta aegis]
MERTYFSQDPEIIIEQMSVRHLFWVKVKGYFRKDVLMILTLTGIILGFALGFGIRELHPSKDAIMWMGMPGELFLRVLRLMVLPLIVCSVISGTASMDPRSNGKISLTAFLFIAATNVLASGLGVVLCVVIQPGVGATHATQINKTGSMETQDIFADLLRNIVPDNMVEATFKQAQTQYSREIIHRARNTTNGTVIESLLVVSKSLGKVDSVNVLGLILICTILGVAAHSVKDHAQVFLQFFSGSTEIILVIIRKLFWIAPLGIASLVAAAIAGITDIVEVFSHLGFFVLAVTVGILIHSFIVLPVILVVLTRQNPFAFLVSIIRPLLIGFATTATAVAIPEMLNSCEEKNKIDKRLARFVVPFCVTLNADGSALYITSAAIFIGQTVFGSVSISDAVVIWILTSVAAFAIPSVPSASIVTLLIILTSLGYPTNGISLLFAVEWYLDRIRTSCNVISHTFCTAVSYRFCKKDLQHVEQRENHEETAVL